MVTYFTEPIETRLGPQDWSLTLSQPLPFPGKLGKKAAVVSADVEIAKERLNITVRDVVVGIQQSWYELEYIRTAQKIAKENNHLLDELRKIAETTDANSRNTLSDIIKAQSQTAQLRYDIILLSELEDTETAKLNAWLNRDPDEKIGPLTENVLPSLEITLPEIYQLLEKNRPEIIIAGLKRKKADFREDLARYSSLPDLKIGLFYAEIGMPDVAVLPRDAGRDAVGIQAGMTIPLWFGKNRSLVTMAAADLEKNVLLQDDIINQAKAKTREIYFRLQNAKRLVTLYRDNLLPQAIGTLNTAESWQREGQGSLSDLIEAQSTVYNFQLSLARAKADFGQFFASLEGLAGVSLHGHKPKEEMGSQGDKS